jgi:hypothetical protein
MFVSFQGPVKQATLKIIKLYHGTNKDRKILFLCGKPVRYDLDMVSCLPLKTVQGGRMAGYRIIQIVASQSTPEKEEEYNRWYTGVHLPMLFGYEGVKRASRYCLLGGNGEHAKYLAIYEFEDAESMAGFSESPEFADAIRDFEAMKETVGFDMKWAESYELVTTLSR